MEEINDDFPSTDVALVVGANDTVNSAAAASVGVEERHRHEALHGRRVRRGKKRAAATPARAPPHPARDACARVNSRLPHPARDACARARARRYAGADNPVFFKPNTEMLLGDAKKTLDEVVAALARDGPSSKSAGNTQIWQ